MKKLLSLTLVLVFSVASFAGAEMFTHEVSGITVDLPADMIGTDVSEDNIIALYIESVSDDSLAYYVILEYDENFADTWMQDLDEESQHSIAEYYTTEGNVYTYTTVDTNTDNTLIVMAEDSNTELIVVALLNGWFISVQADASEGYELADGAIEDTITLLQSIQLPA